MLFNSYAFVFLFLPIAVIGFELCKKTGKVSLAKAFLVLLSFWFYGFAGLSNLPVLVVSMAVNYGIFIWMQKTEKKKLPLWVGLVLSLGALFFFKYTGSAFVPLAISFFTFSQIAFLMEAYRGNLKKTGLLDYSFYLTFFPKMIQGPIALPGELEGQVEEAMQKAFDWERFYRNLCLFVMGLSKKVLLADTFGGAVSHGYTNPVALNTGDAWIVMLSYTLQLYFDFSGYSDMAMAVAGMLGFTLPLNFDAPYKAANILEFWKGWHISLTRFFTKYLYIPLGGNRKGRGRMYLNTLIVFLVSGIWHGSGLPFIIWGMMHGVLYVITRWCKERRLQAETVANVDKSGMGSKLGGKVKRMLSVAATFLYVNVAWVFFRAPSVGDAVTLLKKLVSFSFGRINWDLAGYFNLDEFWYVIKVLHIDSWQYAHYILMVLLLLLALLLVFFAKTAVQVSRELKPGVIITTVMAILFVWCVITFSQVSSFLYVNF